MTVAMILKLMAVVVVALVLCFCAPSDQPGKTASLPKHPKIPSVSPLRS